MTPEKQRIAIAEACGWSCKPMQSIAKPSGALATDVPNYTGDLNACHEMEKVLTEKQQVWYMQKLTQVRYKAGVSGMIGCMMDKIVFATAPQRCEAFLRTISKWEDAK